MTMKLISTVTVGAGGASSIEFSSIPQTGTDLYLTMSLKASSGSGWLWFTLNNDTGSNYSSRNLNGTGSSVGTQSLPNMAKLYSMGGLFPPSTHQWNNVSLYIPNYAGSIAKSMSIDGVTENNATLAYQAIVAGLWSGTAAISSLQILPDGTMAEGSTASLYTILTDGATGANVSTTS